MPSRHPAADKSLRRPVRARTVVEWLSVGCHPRLIYDAAAAAKTVSVFIQARSGYPKAILVKSSGHSINSGICGGGAPLPSRA
jgi:hypothetical protein